MRDPGATATATSYGPPTYLTEAPLMNLHDTDPDSPLRPPASAVGFEHPLAEAAQAMRGGDLAEAARLSSEHALFGPPLERSEALTLYAQAMAGLGGHEEATDGFRAALLVDPGAYEALEGLARLRRDEGMLGDAVDLATQALRIACAQDLGPDYRTRGVAALLADLGAAGTVEEVCAEHGIGPASLVRAWLTHRR